MAGDGRRKVVRRIIEGGKLFGGCWKEESCSAANGRRKVARRLIGGKLFGGSWNEESCSAADGTRKVVRHLMERRKLFGR